MEALRFIDACLGPSSLLRGMKLRHLLCLVSWQEALGLLCLLCWAVAALTPNMWTCFPGGDTWAWLRMQLSLALARGHRWWTVLHLIAVVNLIEGLWRLSSTYMKRRREMLLKRDERRRAHQVAAMARQRQHDGLAGDGSASQAEMSSK